MNWSHLEYFLAVASNGSLSAAAKQLGVNHSTVARRIDKLEQQLQTRLFDRLNNGYQLTERGLALQQQAMQIEAQMNQIQRRFQGDETELHGRLKISKPSSGILNLADLLTGFQRRYPSIDIELTAASALSDLSRLEADVAIRITDTPPEDLIGRELGKLPVHVYGSRQYLKQAGTLDPRQCQWLLWHDPDIGVNLEQQLLALLPEANIVLRSTCYAEVFEAVTAGMGISLLSPLRLPTGHQLRALSPELYSFNTSVWLLSHPDLRNSERVKVFKQFAIRQFSDMLDPT